MASASRPALSRLETDVMSVVWDLGEATSAEIVEAVTRKQPLAPTTIRTVLSKIEEKGYIVRVPTVERALRYKPAYAREKVASQSLRQLVRKLFGGSSKLAIAQLIADEKLDDDELAELAAMIAKRRGRR
jgi:BlaI family penicillinase repressor